MFTNNINARKMLSEVFAYQAPVPSPKAPRGKARAAPAQVEETFESDSESSYQGSVRSSSSLVSVDVPVPPMGSAAPRVGPTKSQKPKKPTAKQMAKTKVEKPLPPPAAPVLKEAPASPVKKSKKLTKKESPAADLPPAKVDLPEKIVLAQKLEQPGEKKKRTPSAYNTFVSKHMKGGLSMVAIAGLWKDQKAGKAAKD